MVKLKLQWFDKHLDFITGDIMMFAVQKRLLVCAISVCSIGLGLSGCTRVELTHKAMAYNKAVADSSNKYILMNAVRASQRYPMYFTSIGDVSATPSVGGETGSEFNVNVAGLVSYKISPSISGNSGFSDFKLGNLNSENFSRRMRKDLNNHVIIYFRENDWPDELIWMLAIQKITVTSSFVSDLHDQRTNLCSASRPFGLCHLIDESISDFESNCGDAHFSQGKLRRLSGATYFNSGRSFCSQLKYQIFLRELRLLGLLNAEKQVGLMRHFRSPQSILHYLGELIAAQLYIDQPFVPKFAVGGRGRWDLVPIFEVRRGKLPGDRVAVKVMHRGESFYIPEPDFGSRTEARSLQVLDLVNQIIVLSTTEDDIPQSNIAQFVNVN